MKFLIIFVLVLIEFCYSSDLKCAYFDDAMEVVEFYCKNFNANLPENCSTTYLYSIGHYNKLKVVQLKIGGCDEEKIGEFVKDFPNIRSLDVSNSNLQHSLKPFDITLEYLTKFNASHNSWIEVGNEFWAKMPRIVEVDFSHNKLQSIGHLPQTLIKIDFSHNNIVHIQRSELKDLPNLQVIDLSHNLVKSIHHHDLFANATHLKTLRLENNRYEYFDENFLDLLKRGVAVHISWRHVFGFKVEENIGKPIRANTTSGIEGIWPSSDGNHIEFHCRIGSFERIESFKFTDNHIENINELLRCLSPSLGQLILTGNFTSNLSSTSIEPFINLWELVINGAQSMEFDLSTIKKPEHLYTLDISGNNVKTIGNMSLLEQFPMMSYFGVADNHLQNTPQLIQHFRRKIIKLRLSGNYVGNLNATTFENIDVYELYLKNTNLSFDDLRPFEPLKSLIKLDISFNNLEKTNFSVPSKGLKGLSQFAAAHCNIQNASTLIELLSSSPIWNLDLSGNNIESLNATIFKRFTKLQTLNLSRNNLKEIDFGIFQDSRYSYEVDLSYNELKRVGVSSASSNLGILYLDGNEITDIEPFTTANFPRLCKMSIRMNQIPCTNLAAFKQNWTNSIFVNNPFEQKHGDCSSVVRLINNLGFVGTLISKWF